ncbi:DedA family protein [Fictibacillus fluitans]|uniref:VTT domain-containing protein n=1 Tax=Fictibacillus fluitans TaxID=3058422 RepID=A0ABT8HW23_9BACL|nr:VTT domain-containing protein [Fictibacillus sp. NE201]MDN4524983.1 VTT domain-containing protein [Fictibacillus sp. NE201]
MLEWMTRLFEEWGVWGILLSQLLEGSSFPFVGSAFMVTAGVLMDFSWMDRVWIALSGSLFYTAGSLVPYLIGLKLGESAERKMSLDKRAKLDKITEYISKYGNWCVAVLSPLPVGNVVPFFAGMSRMNIWKYSLLTMTGTFPATLLFLGIGYFYSGEKGSAMDIILILQVILFMMFTVIALLIAVWKYIVNRRPNKQKNF